MPHFYNSEGEPNNQGDHDNKELFAMLDALYPEEDWIDVEDLCESFELEHQFIAEEVEERSYTFSDSVGESIFMTLIQPDSLQYSASGVTFPTVLGDDIRPRNAAPTGGRVAFKARTQSIADEFGGPGKTSGDPLQSLLRLEAEEKRKLPYLKVGAALLLFLCLGGLCFGFWMKGRSVNEEVFETYEDPIISGAKDRLVDAKKAAQVAQDFLKARTLEEVLPLVAKDEDVEKSLAKYWKPIGNVKVALNYTRSSKFGETGLEVYVFHLKTSERELKVLPVIKNAEGSYLVDWSSFESIQNMSIADFKECKTVEDVFLRGAIYADTYYNEGYNEESWHSFRLVNPVSSAEYVNFYVKKRSPQAAKLKNFYKGAAMKESPYRGGERDDYRGILVLKKREKGSKLAEMVNVSSHLGEILYLRSLVLPKKTESITSD